MRALACLLGARPLDAAHRRTVRRRLPEPSLPPLASTPEAARAWRRWAQAGRGAGVGEAQGPGAPLGAGGAVALEPGSA